MIIKKIWEERKYTAKYKCRGYYLFGFIPLYVVREKIEY